MNNLKRNTIIISLVLAVIAIIAILAFVYTNTTIDSFTVKWVVNPANPVSPLHHNFF